MRISFSILFAVVLALPTFTAPVPNGPAVDESALEVRAKKIAPAKAKAAIPANKAPLANKASSTAIKVPIPAKKVAPQTSTAVRRWLEYIGLARRATPAACPTVAGPSSPALSAAPVLPVASVSSAAPSASAAPLTKEEKAAQKAAKAAEKQAKFDAKKASQAAAAASAVAAKGLIGSVANAPTRDVRCDVRPTPTAPGTASTPGTPVVIPLASIQSAVSLAQEGPVKNGDTFPHLFENKDSVTGLREVNLDAPCIPAPGTEYLEYAVGFRVVITKPDPVTGATTFCGVMTHGPASTAGGFDSTLCAEV
ncbi:hypothetical protein B0H17DRAFT_1064945 [Mycena rosella]|uniref:Uncharacterized protein n=1 Tax=Mycena rosella TaxID=1033263 RepID=A0AAD7DG83_MYCRO|nr:hypothetical protein B0H17DRAFT_1064945 [Mycena rosella]